MYQVGGPKHEQELGESECGSEKKGERNRSTNAACLSIPLCLDFGLTDTQNGSMFDR